MSHALTLTPLNGYGGYPGYPGTTSSLKSVSFFLLFMGIILISIGYLRSENRSRPPRVEYRYVPRSFQEEQSENAPLMSIFGNLFNKRDPLLRRNGFVNTFPWEQYNISSRLVTPFSNPSSGFGRAVGQRIVG